MNKDVFQIILFAALLAIVGIRIYNKYYKKSGEKTGEHKKQGSNFQSSSKEEDYEPYMKK